MTLEEMQQMLTSIRAEKDDVARSNLLLKLDEDYTTMLATQQTQAQQIAELTTKNTEYVKQNNTLWLKLGANVNVPNDTPPAPIGGEHAPKLSYDDLKF